MADWQKTPVITFKTANMVNEMYNMKTTFQAKDKPIKGVSAICQEMPPVMDMKSVDTASPIEPQKPSSARSLADQASLGRSCRSTNRSMAAEDNMIAKTYMMSASNTKAQTKDFNVTKMEWIRVRNAFNHIINLAMRVTRISRLMRSTRITRMADMPEDELPLNSCSLARISKAKAKSMKDETTIKQSRHAHRNKSESL